MIESYAHDLQKLVRVAGLEQHLNDRAAGDASFKQNRAIVKDWDEASRYTLRTASQAGALVGAIGNDDHGVMRWLRERW